MATGLSGAGAPRCPDSGRLVGTRGGLIRFASPPAEGCCAILKRTGYAEDPAAGFPRTAADDTAWYTAAADWIGIDPAGTARKYGLTLDPGSDHNHLWRHLGEADAITQRWRFLGRPIHNWFQPKSHGTLKSPTVVQLHQKQPDQETTPIEEFESEAFARSDTDAVSRTVRLKHSASRR